MTITQRLAEFAASIKHEDLSLIVRERTCALTLDLVGSIVRARHESDSTPALLATIRTLGLCDSQGHVFSDPALYSFAGSALINGVLAHSLDFDDTHAAAILHPGAAVIPAAIAAAEAANASGAVSMAGIVAGYEVALRLSLALPAGRHYDAGFHPSATCGAFGAAAAAGRVLGLTPGQMASAFGIALSQTAGSLQFLANGAWTKRFQVGWAASSGLFAATLAKEGFIGAANAIDGKHGFLRSYSDAPEPDRISQGLGDDFELMQTGVKPYPSCRWGHAGIDAALAFRRELNFAASDIEDVKLGLSKAGMLLIGEPLEKKQAPANIVDAQFSGPFVIAAALATGKFEWNSFSLLGDPEIRRLMSKVSCYNEPQIEAEFPHHMAGLLTIVARGKTYRRKVIDPSGEPAAFPSNAQLQRKFMGLTANLIPDAEARDLAVQLLQLDSLADMSALFRTRSSVL